MAGVSSDTVVSPGLDPQRVGPAINVMHPIASDACRWDPKAMCIKQYFKVRCLIDYVIGYFVGFYRNVRLFAGVCVLHCKCK